MRLPIRFPARLPTPLRGIAGSLPGALFALALPAAVLAFAGLSPTSPTSPTRPALSNPPPPAPPPSPTERSARPGGQDRPPQELPPLSEQPAMMVGNAACVVCHDAPHQTWTASRHSKMVQPAIPKAVLGDFSVGTTTLRGERYGLQQRGDEYFITEPFFTGEAREHRIDYTLGNRRIQHYLTTLEDGRIIVLPPSWDVLREEWFHNLEIAAPDQQQGIIPVQLWNKNCFGCHVSDQVKGFRPDEDRYDTTWLDFGTTCERCHGPGSRHVDKYHDLDRYGGDPESHIVLQTELDHERNSMVCASCHSFRDQMDFGYRAGDDYYDHFLPLLEYTQEESEDPTWYPDGKTRRFSTNALGVWQSECFVEGGATCTGCHVNAHLPDIERNRQLRPTNNALCTGCHEAIGEDLTAHTFHAAESAGSSCVECHMPRSVVSIRATMRDHSISVPSPRNTARYGIPNACNECHQAETPEWADARMDEWWGDTPRRRKIERRARAYSGARELSREALDDLLAMSVDEAEGPLNRANASGHLGRYLADADTRETALAALLEAAADPHPLVRAVAALKLGETGGGEAAGVRDTLVERVRDGKRVVRMNAAISLLNLGVRQLPGDAGERFELAKRRHAIRGNFFADDAPQQLNMGRLHVLDGNPAAAERAFEQSYSLDPDQPGIRFFMAITRLSQQRLPEAVSLLRSVPGDDPFSAEAADLLRRVHPGE